LYPEGVGASRYLRYYDQTFPTVEINASFYRPLSPKSVEKWCQDTPMGFRFAARSPKNVTHILRLRNAGELVADFTQNISGFGEKLGPVLVQLPPSLARGRRLAAEVPGLRPRRSPDAANRGSFSPARSPIVVYYDL